MHYLLNYPNILVFVKYTGKYLQASFKPLVLEKNNAFCFVSNVNCGM